MPITIEDIERIIRDESRERYATEADRGDALKAAIDARIREEDQDG